MKRMQHPQHGFHYAYTDAEEATMRANGWLPEFAEAQDESASSSLIKAHDPDASAPSTVVQMRRKPGRPRKAA